MARNDLLHLSAEALTQMTNAGLVKRAVRELAGGYRPRLSEDAQGEISAQFDDGVLSVLPPNVPLPDARCSCGAAGLCRHRIIAVLAYREAGSSPVHEEESATAVLEGVQAIGSGPIEVGLTTDEALAQVVPAALLKLAERLSESGLSIELRRRSSGEPCDTARLPAATVRYWAGAAIEAARCDCARAMACEHVALGVWAFRKARLDERADLASDTVRLGDSGTRESFDRTPYEQYVEALIRHGVAHGSGPLTQALSTARMASSNAAWLALLVADMEAWSEAYARRSALYDAACGVDLIAELALRLSAGCLPGHGDAVLGIGQGAETPLDRLRLMSLGARTVRDGEARRTTLIMADVDTGTRLVLAHDWQVPEARLANELDIRAAERLAPGVLLPALAQGQLLTQQAARRPDGSVRLARARRSQNSVLPQSGDWAMLCSPVRFDSIDALIEDQHAHPNAALQPRHAARRFVVFSPSDSGRVVYDAQEQSVLAEVLDEQGQALILRRAYERHVPHALDALAAGLSGRQGQVRHVAGVLSWEHGQPVLEPWALVCDHLLVPDLADAFGALSALPLGTGAAPAADPGTTLLEQLRQQTGTLLHNGLALLPRSWQVEALQLARQLASAGFQALASEVQTLVPLVTQAQARPQEVSLAPASMRLMALLQLHWDAMAIGN